METPRSIGSIHLTNGSFAANSFKIQPFSDLKVCPENIIATTQQGKVRLRLGKLQTGTKPVIRLAVIGLGKEIVGGKIYDNQHLNRHRFLIYRIKQKLLKQHPNVASVANS